MLQSGAIWPMTESKLRVAWSSRHSWTKPSVIAVARYLVFTSQRVCATGKHSFGFVRDHPVADCQGGTVQIFAMEMGCIRPDRKIMLALISTMSKSQVL